MLTRTPHAFAAALLLTLLAFAGCSDYRESVDRKLTDEELLHADVKNALEAFHQAGPVMKKFFATAYGYAIFPTVDKGAVGIGGAHGEGEVYEQGNFVGHSTLSQATLGLQLGGQAYREIIFFKDKPALDTFKSGHYEFSAQASAVAADSGASADADFKNGIAVFTLTKGGLMFEASVGGQKFTYRNK